MPVKQANSQLGKAVGAKIRAARLSMKYNQSQLARPDFSVSYISAIERGQIQPSLRALEILAKRLGIPSAQLVLPDTQDNHSAGFATNNANNQEVLVELALLEAHIYILHGDASIAITQLSELPSSKLHKWHRLRQCFLLGWAYLLTFELQKCMDMLADAEILANEQNDALSSLHIYNLMGAAYAYMGDAARALQAHQHCLTLLGATNPQDALFMCHLYNQLGQHYAQQQQFDAAVSALKEAIAITEELSTPEKLQTAYWKSALHYLAAKDYQAAQIYFHKCLELQNQHMYSSLRSEIYHYLGRVMMRGDQEKARTYLEVTLEQKHDQLDALTLASIMTHLAEWHLLHNQLPEANNYAKKACGLAEPFGARLIASEALIMWGRIHYAQARYKSGDTFFTGGLKMLEQLNMPEEQSDQSALYAQLLETRGKKKEALQYYKRAYESLGRGSENI